MRLKVERENGEMMITRRTFMQQSLAAAGTLVLAPSVFAEEAQVMTVTGAIAPEQMGFTLPHEHIMSIFGGKPAKVAQYDEEKLFATVIPYLKMLKTFGVETLCDCTAAYFGRRVDLLQRISKETGLQILTNTGYYGAAKDLYVPEHVYKETADQIARRWIDEWENGIDGTDIRPGFIKIGVDPGMPSDIDKKLILAAGRTHLETGLTIASHTSGSTDAAVEQVAMLEEMGVDLSAWIWVHAQNVKDPGDLWPVAQAGAWISLDGIRKETLDHHINVLSYLRRFRVLRRVLLSHDGNSFRYGDRPFKPYDAIFDQFIPLMKRANFREEEIRMITVENPRKAFGVRVRKVEDFAE
jgi:predicted metal-dependent phosphotriesterase family hydrolase